MAAWENGEVGQTLGCVAKSFDIRHLYPAVRPPNDQSTSRRNQAENSTIVSERNGKHTSGVSLQHVLLLLGFSIPDADGLVIGTRRDLLSIWRPGHVDDNVFVPCKRQDRLASLRIPQLDGFVPRAGPESSGV